MTWARSEAAMRSRLPWIGLAAALAWLGYLAFSTWYFEGDLARAGRDMEAGRLSAARGRLVTLATRRPGHAEVEYLLGLCEQGLGRPDQALEAWGRMPPRSPFAARVALPWARTLILERGQFAAAEELLEIAIRGGGPSGFEARGVLSRLFFWQGRLGEMRRLLQDGWATSPDRPGALRELWNLDTDPIPAEAVRASLDQAARRSPGDDRAWLARANLATRSGRLDEALSWLDACLRRRPDDPPVWRARLDWAVVAENEAEAWRASTHLATDRVSSPETHSLRAWLAARRGLPEIERHALESLIKLEPGNSRALERLVELFREAGLTDRAAESRRAKAAIDAAKERYHDLLAGPLRPARFEELARLAETLGRRFEARGWWTLLIVSEPDNPKFRAALDGIPLGNDLAPRATGRTLADLLADLSPGPEAHEPPRIRQPRSSDAPAIAPLFRDDAGAARLTSFHFDNGSSPLHQLPETTSGGVGLIDYDGDGWLDVYFVQGGAFPPDHGPPAPGDMLFRNRRDNTFEDVSSASGIAALSRGYGHGVAVGDFDNDGHADLFRTRWRGYSLLRNRGDGSFEDVTAKAGLAGDRDWPTSAAFADLDGDGDLDLYVCHYLEWDAAAPRTCPDELSGRNVACFPRDFKALPDHVFRNDGGRFVDVSGEAGLVDHDGRGLGVVAADLNDDGRVDLYVANDATANFLFSNLGGFRFEDTAQAAGAAASADGGYQAGMGVACGDLDGDGRPDLTVTNLINESTTFYRNLGGGTFSDQTAAIGLAAPSRFLLGFGIAMADVNDDGHLDLMTANGHVSDLRPRFVHAMPAQLLLGAARGRLIDVTADSGPPFRVAHVGRGLAAGDLDNDGRIDAVLVAQNEPPVYLHNRTEGGHSLTIRLEGVASNRDAVGARVTLTHGDRRQVAQRVGGGSYQSASDLRLHFGLGADDRAVSAEVRWPSGRVDLHRDLAADRGYHLREGDGTARPLAGFGKATPSAGRGLPARRRRGEPDPIPSSRGEEGESDRPLTVAVGAA